MNRFVITGQALYYAVTAAWPVLSMSSFEAVTGAKNDHWLVYTVSALLAAIAVALFGGARKANLSVETLLLACGTALAIGAIDIFYVFRGTIRPIYLADAMVEAVFLFAPLFNLWWIRRRV